MANSPGSLAARRALWAGQCDQPHLPDRTLHRVIGADGTMTGYAFGEKIKRRLLALDGCPILRL